MVLKKSQVFGLRYFEFASDFVCLLDLALAFLRVGDFGALLKV